MHRTATLVTLGAVTAVALVVGIWTFSSGPLRSPDSALTDFLAAADGSLHRAEDQLADPLILTGCRSAPLVRERIRDPEMPLRRYALFYLGNRRCAEALPELRTILHDDSELGYFRSDALEAIYQIDPTEGTRFAESYTTRDDHLGYVARELAESGLDALYARSYLDAVRHVHR